MNGSSRIATAGASVITTNQEESNEPSLKLRLRQSSDENEQNEKQVKFKEGTIDNEHLNKKKSKCCCIYEKPRKFGESSSEDENDDEVDSGHHCPNHCHGSKKYHKNAYNKPKSDN
ncbi:E3 ubiquitin-protein ligase PPP1R11 [Sarcoptes scabiei]|uniref:E3 ubiquitin-protein ligase PPP1R11 n=1 Tax=Sarcoptes scabiei TaxID=52283 RepID=A0A834R8V1_SARSC|nr:E3 ubiquitin-protein ligase PPP1R11 [Sarcoptes scabiei]